MHERGDHYLARSEPVATWMATLDPVTLAVRGLGPAPDPSAALYGWSVASDRRFTYLFSHCHRQFGFGLLGHDPCTAEVRVARVPRGQLDAAPQYWDGHDWVADPGRAVNVAPTSGPDGERRVVNPMQFAYANGRWLAVTKEGDWWGTTVYLDRAAAPDRAVDHRVTAAPPRPRRPRRAQHVLRERRRRALVDGRRRAQQQPLGRPSVEGLPADVRRRAVGGVGPPAAGSALSRAAARASG